MVHSAVRHLFHILSGLTLVVLIGLGVLLWRLDQGPISLRDVLPYVEEALNDPSYSYRMTMDDLFLAWEGGNRSLDLRAENVRIQSAEGPVVAVMPEVGLQVSPSALWRGKLRMRGVEIMHPFLNLVRDKDGTASLGIALQRPDSLPTSLSSEESTAEALPEQDAQDMVAALVSILSKPQQGLLSELSVVRVVDAEAVIRDYRLGVLWTIPTAALELYRSGNGRVGMSGGVELAIPPGPPPARPHEHQDASAGQTAPKGPPPTTHLDVMGAYRPDGHALDLTVHFAELRPARLAGLADSLQPLSAVDVPLAGRVSLSLGLGTGQARLTALTVDLSGKKGRITLPDLEQADNPTPAAVYAVEDLTLKASAAARKGESLLGGAGPAGDGIQSLAVESLVAHLIPPTAARHGGNLAQKAGFSTTGSSTVSPSEVSVHGALTRQDSGQGFAGSLTAGVKSVPVAALRQWWPLGVGPNPRAWITGHLDGGKVQTGQWRVSLAGTSLATVDATALEGHLQADGVMVDYLPPMPPVRQAVADVAFALDKLTVTVKGGEVRQDGAAPLVLTGGHVEMSGLDQPHQMTDIALDVQGTVPAALGLLDSDPLGYTRKLGLSPAQTAGNATTRVHLRFPPLADLRLDQIEVDAAADLQDVTLRKGVFGQDLTRGALSLRVSTTQLQAKGKASLAGIPATFTWQENFSGTPFSSRYRVHATLPQDKRALFGLTFPPFTPGLIDGPIPADLTLTAGKAKGMTVAVKADLTPTTVTIPGFNWHKDAGVAAHARADIQLHDGVVTAVPKFAATSGESLSLRGQVTLGSKGTLKQVILDQSRIGQSVFAGTVTRSGPGYVVDAHGPALDLVPFMQGSSESADGTKGTATDAAGSADDQTTHGQGDASDRLPITISGQFDTVWLSEDGTIQSFKGVARRAAGHWVWADVTAQIDGSAPINFHLGPRRTTDVIPEKRTFRLQTTDTGGLLRALGWLGTMDGGVLKGQGTVDPTGRSTGVITIGPYRLRDAPVLARILSVAALTGVLDALSGEGIGFDGMTMPFTADDDAIVLKDVRTSGSALGLTASGRLHMRARQFDVAGTIVPAYAVNGLLGKLPLVGGLLSGFTEGGGLFAATYSLKGPFDDPKISVNPLSALAPGFLRTLFGMGEPEEDVDSEAGASTAQPTDSSSPSDTEDGKTKGAFPERNAPSSSSSSSSGSSSSGSSSAAPLATVPATESNDP